VKTLKKTWELLLDILFPKICLNCKKYLGENESEYICAACFQQIENYKIVFRPNKDFVLLSAVSYDNKTARELLHYFKYEGFQKIEVLLKTIFERYLKEIDYPLQDFIIVPIPLTSKKLRQRGFNQSEILAKIASDHLKLPIETGVLLRVKETKPQIGMKNHEERKENVKNSFEVKKSELSKIKGRNILLVDDVYTSGATMNEAVKTLKKAGSSKILGLVFAKAG